MAAGVVDEQDDSTPVIVVINDEGAKEDGDKPDEKEPEIVFLTPDVSAFVASTPPR